MTEQLWICSYSDNSDDPFIVRVTAGQPKKALESACSNIFGGEFAASEGNQGDIWIAGSDALRDPVVIIAKKQDIIYGDPKNDS